MARSAPLCVWISFSVLLGSVGASAQSSPEPSGWTGYASLGVALTSGNSDTSTVNAAYDLKHDRGKTFVFKSTGLFLYGTAEDVETSNNLALVFRIEPGIDERTSMFFQTQYLRDEFKSIDYLVAPTLGLNRILLKNDRTELNADLGGGVVWEQDRGVERRTESAITAGEKFTRKLTNTTELTQRLSALWKVNNVRDALYTFSAAIAANITSATQMKIEILDTYKTLPPPTVQKNDLATLLSFVYKID